MITSPKIFSILMLPEPSSIKMLLSIFLISISPELSLMLRDDFLGN
jgi:hypothetical protein